MALSTAFVIPEEHVLSGVAIESHRATDSIYDALPAKDDVVNAAESALSKVLKVSTNAFDQAIEHAEEHTNHLIEKIEELAADAAPWQEPIFNSEDHGKHGHHGHHCPKPNQTVYQLISTNKYTTKLAELINEYDDLVTLLNGTAANYTIFAPIDSAFEKVPEHAPKPSKEDVKKFLQYHISSDFYPAGRVLVSHTIPSSLTGEHLGGELQRLSTQIGLRGLTVNFYSRIIAIDYVRTYPFLL